EAGITLEGYGHGVTIVDINSDGWKDIYVTNDFLSNNILYINNHNGTFTNEVETYFKHTSENSMGQDVIDINNDGLVDVMEVDMNPEDNLRKKTMMNTLHYQRYQYNEYFGYQYQYVRNVLQINQGPRILENDSIGPPVFSDVAFYSGIAETDWSWTPSIVDFDNDGYRDIIITNGFPKDITDHDFSAFRRKAYNLVSKKELLEQIPKVKISNYAYKNNGDLTFKDVTKDWGINLPTFSNGAAYADLDNDGDIDHVVNNIDDKALVYRNNSRQINKNDHYLQIKFSGDTLNKNGLGACVELHYKGKQQVYENTPYRGYLSSVYPIAHFGLGNERAVDSVIIKWPGGQMQLIQNVKADQVIKADIKNAHSGFSFAHETVASGALLKEITSSVDINYTHKERDFNDFNIQKLLPHKLSEYGPALAAGDIDGNGLDDIVMGGSLFYDTQIFLQQNNGHFKRKTLLGKGDSIETKNSEDLGLLLFDADNDNDLDLYIASGGYEMKNNTFPYKDRFY
ncbi:MAG TPA: CRTAC1 family protein, partial [Segetibacter sp.]|nr:CRTAC1 family protein [Segetibacter sp.]